MKKGDIYVRRSEVNNPWENDTFEIMEIRNEYVRYKYAQSFFGLIYLTDSMDLERFNFHFVEKK